VIRVACSSGCPHNLMCHGALSEVQQWKNAAQQQPLRQSPPLFALCCITQNMLFMICSCTGGLASAVGGNTLGAGLSMAGLVSTAGLVHFQSVLANTGKSWQSKRDAWHEHMCAHAGCQESSHQSLYCIHAVCHIVYALRARGALPLQ
jgi:hypothetical protein